MNRTKILYLFISLLINKKYLFKNTPTLPTLSREDKEQKVLEKKKKFSAYLQPKSIGEIDIDDSTSIPKKEKENYTT